MRNTKRIAVLGLIVMIAAAAALAERPGDGQQDMDRFFKAKELVFMRDWDSARTGLESYLKDFPAGRMRDEALYWLAQSLDQMSREAKGREAVVRFKKAAVDHLRTLIETYPASLWKEDAATLRVEIAGTLVLLGEDSYKSVIDEAARASGKSSLDIKLTAVAALADLDPKTALPVLRRELASEPDAEVRLRAVRLLARFTAEDALPVLGEVVQKDKEERVRSEASSLVRLFERSRSPVRLRYFIYGSRLLDEGLETLLPDKEVQEFLLARSAQGAARALLAKARKVLGGEISSPASSANGTLPLSIDFSLTTQIVHRAGDYNIWINERTMELGAAQIRGEIEFRHRESGEVFTRRFSVDPAHDKLLVVRSGANLSLLLFQFTGEQGADETSGGERTRIDLGDFGHGAYFADILGWEVRSSKSTWDLDEFSGRPGKYDFGRAEAVSKSPSGWVLRGDLLLLTEERVFIARQGVLVQPSGKTAAEAPEIFVPLDDPSAFYLEERPKRGASPGPDYGPLKIAVRIALARGITVHTERTDYDLGVFDKNLIDLEQARADIPDGTGQKAGAVRTLPGDLEKLVFVRTGQKAGAVWTLLGDLFYFKDQEKLIGCGSVLINPGHEVVAEGLIEVPADGPARFRVLSGRTIEKSRRSIAASEERRTRPIYPVLYANHLGWEVLTTRNSADETAGTGMTDFGLARAVRSYGGREWILIGQIISLNAQRKFLARQAALIASDGTIVYGAEILVSADNPEDHTIVRKDP